MASILNITTEDEYTRQCALPVVKPLAKAQCGNVLVDGVSWYETTCVSFSLYSPCIYIMACYHSMCASSKRIYIDSGNIYECAMTCLLVSEPVLALACRARPSVCLSVCLSRSRAGWCPRAHLRRHRWRSGRHLPRREQYSVGCFG